MNAPADSPGLRADGLACVRGDRQLFSGVSFALAGGTLLQVRGPNGSGKTSLLRMICGLLAPAAGTISWNGRPVRELAEEYSARLAYVGHQNALKDDLDPGENLTLAAQLAGLPHDPAAITGALRELGLASAARLPCKLLSQGQRRRAALARLKVSGERPLWVLDEPFAALDAQGVRHVRSLLDDHLAGGGIVILTTHQDVGVTAVQRVDLEL